VNCKFLWLCPLENRWYLHHPWTQLLASSAAVARRVIVSPPLLMILDSNVM
jgi:hypothetical protein